MSILNTVMGALGGGASGGSPVMSVVTSMLSGQGEGNGIGSLLQQFQQNGLGDAAQSWIGSGENAALSADQVSQAFGANKIAEMAQQAGISTEDFSSQLSQILPQAVDKMTPDGEVPSGNLDVASITSALGGLFK